MIIWKEKKEGALPMTQNSDQFNPYVAGLTNREKDKRAKAFLRTRLSKNYILQDFFKNISWSKTETNWYPRDKYEHIIECGRALAAVCEAIESEFGRITITYGYNTPEIADAGSPNRTSDPHCWCTPNRFEGQIFARMDVMIFSVEDGHYTKHDVAKWLIKNTMVDLVMSFSTSNVLCITVCPRPRRVYKEWVPMGQGQNGSNAITHIGETYWQCEYNTQADWLKPVGTPSYSGGGMNWWAKFNAIGY